MTDYKTVALVPAAGMGARMGADINKQYLLLKQKPIVARTLSVFEQSPLINAIYLVTPEQEIPYCRENIVEAFAISKVADIIPGGKERQNSVYNGLVAMRSIMADDDMVVIHDGVRPFINEETLSSAISSARDYDGAIVAVPVKDTVKTVDGTMITRTPPRESLWLAQTPQVFRYKKILDAHIFAINNNYTGTDDSSLVEYCGGKVTIIKGSYSNIKITTPEDLIIAEALLAEKDGEMP